MAAVSADPARQDAEPGLVSWAAEPRSLSRRGRSQPRRQPALCLRPAGAERAVQHGLLPEPTRPVPGVALGGPLRYGAADARNTRAVGLLCPGSGRATRVVGVRLPRSPGADPVHQVESWLHVKDGLAAQLGPRTTSATRPKSRPTTETDAQHDCEICQPRTTCSASSPTTRNPPADLYPPAASHRLGGQQPHDEPSHLGRHSSPGRGIEVSSHPCRRRQDRPAAVGCNTTSSGVPMATRPRTWRPPPKPPTHLARGPGRPSRLLHQRTGHGARGAHRPRGRSHPAGRTQPALPGRRPRPTGRDPHRPQHPHPPTSPAGPARRHRPAASQQP